MYIEQLKEVDDIMALEYIADAAQHAIRKPLKRDAAKNRRAPRKQNRGTFASM